MPLDFPTGPTSGQIYVFDDITYAWNSYAWVRQTPRIPPPKSNSQLAVYWGNVGAPTVPLGVTAQFGFVDVPVKSATSKLIVQAGITVSMPIGQPSHQTLAILHGASQLASAGKTSHQTSGELGCLMTAGFLDHGLPVGSIVTFTVNVYAGPYSNGPTTTLAPWLLVQEIEES